MLTKKIEGWPAADFRINLLELLRVIQRNNLEGSVPCVNPGDSADGFCRWEPFGLRASNKPSVAVGVSPADC